MHPNFAKTGEKPAVPLLFVNAATLEEAAKTLDERGRAFVKAAGFEAKAGKHLLVPGADGTLGAVLFGIEAADSRTKDLFRPGQLATLLPPGLYCFGNAPHDARLAALAFALGAYQFTRYRKAEARNVRLVVPDGVDGDDLTRIVEGVTLGPRPDQQPIERHGPARTGRCGTRRRRAARREVLCGEWRRTRIRLPDDPCRGPRLGACAAADRHDLGRTLRSPGDAGRQGRVLRHRRARHQAGRRHAADEKRHGRSRDRPRRGPDDREARLPVRLRVLIPAVENSISGTAFRPGDVLKSRKGLTVEIGNTDAEGRLILADALALADDDTPDLLLDFATLTGAARVALGPDLPPLYTDDDTLAADLLARRVAGERSGLADAAMVALRWHAQFQNRRPEQRVPVGLSRDR